MTFTGCLVKCLAGCGSPWKTNTRVHVPSISCGERRTVSDAGWDGGVVLVGESGAWVEVASNLLQLI